MKTKKCPSCGETKPVEAFPLGCLKPDGTRYGCGRNAHCKACHITRARARRAGMSKEQQKAVAAREKAYRDSHPHAMRAKWANQHAKRVGAIGMVSEAEVKAAWDRFNGCCWICGDVADTLDHYRPLNGKSGGTNTADNIRPICRECNQKRSHRWHGDAVAAKEARLLRQLKKLLKQEAVPSNGLLAGPNGGSK